MEDQRQTEVFPLFTSPNQFEFVRKGYRPRQVDELIERLQQDNKIALADGQASAARAADLATQLNQARTEIEQLRVKLKRLENPTSMENIGERVKHLLTLAEQEANELRTKTEAEAAELE